MHFVLGHSHCPSSEPSHVRSVLGAPSPSESFPVPPALFPVEMWVFVQMRAGRSWFWQGSWHVLRSLAGVWCCVLAGEFLQGMPVWMALVCTGWVILAAFKAEFREVFQHIWPLNEVRISLSSSWLPWTPADSGAWSWSQTCELLILGIAEIVLLSCGESVCWEWSPELHHHCGWHGGVMEQVGDTKSSLSGILGSLSVFHVFF